MMAFRPMLADRRIWPEAVILMQKLDSGAEVEERASSNVMSLSVVTDKPPVALSAWHYQNHVSHTPYKTTYNEFYVTIYLISKDSLQEDVKQLRE